MRNPRVSSARFRFVAWGALLALAGCTSSSSGAPGTGGQGVSSASGGAGAGVGTGGAGGGAGSTAPGGHGGTTASGGQGGTTASGGHGGSGTTDAASDVALGTAMNPVAMHGQLEVVGTQLEDQSGNPVQLKGVSSQWLNSREPDLPREQVGHRSTRAITGSCRSSAPRWAPKLGRLPRPARTPKAGMLTKVNTIVQNAIDLGIYVIVDWHTSAAVTATDDAAGGCLAFFTKMATQYGSSPNIIYEDFNEPTGRHLGADQALSRGGGGGDPRGRSRQPHRARHADLFAGRRPRGADPVAGTNLLYTLHFYACTHKQALLDKANIAIAMGLAAVRDRVRRHPADGGSRQRDNNVCEAEANIWFAWMATEQHQRRVVEAGSVYRHELHPDLRRASRRPLDRRLPHQDTGGTPIDGGEKGGGHGQFVVNWMRE